MERETTKAKYVSMFTPGTLKFRHTTQILVPSDYSGGVYIILGCVYPGFLSWFCIRLHDTTRNCRTGASSPHAVAVPDVEFHSGAGME